MVKSRTILSILFSLIAITCFCQPQQLYFKHLTTENGLSQGVVNNILTDKRGFTWLTSYDGINRFDGTNCISNNQIGPGMEGISVTIGILEDKNGDIWIGSDEALIKYSYLTNQFEKFAFNEKEIGKKENQPSYYRPLAVYDNYLLIDRGYSFLLLYNTVTNQTIKLNIPDNFEGDNIKGSLASSAVKGFTNKLLFIKENKKDFSFLD